MPDLDTSLRELRDDLHAAIPLPDVDRMAGRARARRRRQLGAIAAVLVVALAVPVLRSLPSGTEAGEQPAAPAPRSQVDFADADHGYALANTCSDDADGCVFTLLATADGGRSWQSRRLPTPPNRTANYFSSTMYVLGTDQLAIDHPTRDGPQRIYSDDGGRTWRELEDRWARESADRLRRNGLLTGVCGAELSGTGPCGALGTILPDSGVVAAVPTQPGLLFVVVGPAATEDGKWWATGRNQAGKWAIAVTGDGGETWSTNPLEVAGTPTADRWAVVERNGVMYATASTVSDLLGVWRSTDDGVTWTNTWHRTEEDRLPGAVGSPIAAGDGTLRYSDGETTYVSTDQGHTFKRSGDEMSGTVRWTRAGYLRSDAGEYALSDDGIHWRKFTVG